MFKDNGSLNDSLFALPHTVSFARTHNVVNIKSVPAKSGKAREQEENKKQRKMIYVQEADICAALSSETPIQHCNNENSHANNVLAMYIFFDTFASFFMYR